MKYLVYTLSMIFLLTLNLKGQDASGEVNPVELTKKEKRDLKKETKKKEKELKKEQKKSKKNKAIKIGELPPEDQEEETNSIKIDVNLSGLQSKKSAEKVKIHRGMSFAYGIIELADISGGGLSFADFEWAQNRSGRFLNSSSQSWDVFFNQYRLSKSPFWFRTGVSVFWSVLDFGDLSYVTTDLSPSTERGIDVTLDPDSANIRTKSSLTTSYLEVPLELVFNSSNDGNRGMTIGIGGYIGMRLQTTRKQNYTDLSGSVRDRRVNQFYNNPLSYGVSARLGYGSIYLKGRFALSKYFQQGADITSRPYQLTAITLGIDFL
jgi:hypothetical protein